MGAFLIVIRTSAPWSSLVRRSTDRKLPGIRIQTERRSVIHNGFFGLSSNASKNQGDTLDYRGKAIEG